MCLIVFVGFRSAESNMTS